MNLQASLFKAVEGAQKFIAPLPGRHILMETGDWYEVNAATLKPLRSIHIFVLNDMLLIAARNQDRRQHEYVACHCHALRDTSINPQRENRIELCFGNRSQCLVQAKNARNYDRLVSTVRGAQDDLNVISQAEEENARRLRDSFSYMQATQQTPGRELAISPTKGHGRNSSLGNNTPHPRDDPKESYLLQTITASMQSQPQFAGSNVGLGDFGRFDDEVEEFDIEFARHNYKEAIKKLESLKKAVQVLEQHTPHENLMILNLLGLRVSHRSQILVAKLTHLTATEIFDFSKLAC